MIKTFAQFAQWYPVAVQICLLVHHSRLLAPNFGNLSCCLNRVTVNFNIEHCATFTLSLYLVESFVGKSWHSNEPSVCSLFQLPDNNSSDTDDLLDNTEDTSQCNRLSGYEGTPSSGAPSHAELTRLDQNRFEWVCFSCACMSSSLPFHLWLLFFKQYRTETTTGTCSPKLDSWSLAGLSLIFSFSEPVPIIVSAHSRCGTWV